MNFISSIEYYRILYRQGTILYQEIQFIGPCATALKAGSHREDCKRLEA